MKILGKLASLFHLPPSGGGMMLSADMGTYLWRDRYGRHWAWQRKPDDLVPRWIPISEFRGWGPNVGR